MREEEDIQRALGTLRKYDVTINTARSSLGTVTVEALNEEDAIAKAKIYMMMSIYGVSKAVLDNAEYTVESHRDR